MQLIRIKRKMDLKRKIVVITNGVTGINQAIAKLFLKRSATVVMTDINEAILKQKALKIGAYATPANLNREENIKQFINNLIQQFGRIDIFISNVGAVKFGNPFLPDAGGGSSWHLNILTQMYIAKHLLPSMIKKGGGYLVNMVPMEGLFAEFHSSLYSTSQHAALFLAKQLATIYKKDNIKVSALCLGALMNLSGTSNLCAGKEHIEEQLEFQVLDAIQREQFMIPSCEKICDIGHRPGFDCGHYKEAA